MNPSISFSGTTFVNQKILMRLPESVASEFDQLIFNPDVGLESAGNDDQYCYFNTGEGKTPGDDAIHQLTKQYGIPAYFTPTGMDIYKAGGIDNYVAQNGNTLEVVQ